MTDDSIGEEIFEEIGLSTSFEPSEKSKKRTNILKSIGESIANEISDDLASGSKPKTKGQSNRFTNSIITETNIVSDFEITNHSRAKADESKAEMIDDTIMSTSVMGSKNLTGRIVKRHGRSGSRSKSAGRNSLNRVESDGSEEIDPGQLYKEKRNFIAKKTK